MDATGVETILEISGGTALLLFTMREILTYLKAKRNNHSPTVSSLSVDSFESKLGHATRDGLAPIILLHNNTNEKLEKIHLALVELITVARERRE